VKVYPLKFEEQFVKPILDNSVSKVVQFSFPKGKVLQKHNTSSDILVFVLQGRIQFSTNEEVTLQAGDMVSLEKNVEHSLKALEQSLVILVLTPSPAAHSIFKPQSRQ
jgi:quercetin dioxygenase-like cupin family protein